MLIASIANAAEPSILELRNLFYQSKKDPAASELLCKRTEKAEDNGSALLLAYKGIGLMMSAKHLFNPYSKLVNFNTGKSLLERALRRDAANPEIRFLRYCIQTQVPGVLGYYANKAEDKEWLLRQWNRIPDADLKQRISAYLMEYGNCTTDEKKRLQ